MRLSINYMDEEEIVPKKLNVRTEKIVSLYVEKGLSMTEIAKLLSISFFTVNSRLKKAGVPIRGQGRQFSSIDNEELLKDRQQGMSLRQLAKKHGVSYQTVANRLESLNADKV